MSKVFATLATLVATAMFGAADITSHNTVSEKWIAAGAVVMFATFVLLAIWEWDDPDPDDLY